MNQFARQEQRHRHREQNCGHSGGRSGWDRLRTEICILPYVKQTADGESLYDKEARPHAPRQPRGKGWGGGGREVQEGGAICILMADLHCCMAEINATL